MNKLNKTGRIKTIILAILFIPNLLFSTSPGPEFGIVTLIMPLLFGILAIPFLAKVNSAIFGSTIEQPTWNDNPLNFKRPLGFFHFAAAFFIVTGTSMLIGTALNFQTLNDFGLIAIFFGLGILIGIRIAVKWLSNQEITTNSNNT